MFKRDTPENLQRLRVEYGHLDGLDLLDAAVHRAFPGRVAAVTSFGAESAVLLDLLAQTAPATPVIFLETGKHFTETLLYRDRLVERLGLTDVRSVAPDPAELAAEDPDGTLHQSAPESCCDLRKVRPLARSLAGFDSWITGRKRFQASTRAGLPTIEWDAGHYKVNPLARWSAQDLARQFDARGLPRHTLATVGYRSIGCQPCTSLPHDPNDPRSGRWAGSSKTECGIHGATWARAVPSRRK